MIKAEFSNSCHSELYKVNRHSEASLVNLYASAKPLAVSESQKQEMLNQVQHDKNKAFTLAEVLITLTIIGVIAALTIPNLMKNYEKKSLETAFKSSVSLLNNALSMMARDEGAGLKAYYAQYSGSYIHATEVSNLYKYLKVTKDLSAWEQNNQNSILPYKSYSKKMTTHSWSNMQKVLANGSSVGISVNYGQWIIVVDTNGYKKGPNIAGYDYFTFNVSDKDTLKYDHAPANCDINNSASDDNSSGGCAYYALLNKCPYDSTKTYWDCLK